MTRIERDGRHVWLGLGPERYAIAWLSRARLLIPLQMRLAILVRALSPEEPVSTSDFVSSAPLPDFSLWNKIAARRVPLSFDLEITARCNNNCRHCYINLAAGDPDARRKELTGSEIVEIAGQAAGMGALWVLLTGGEPLLRKDFAEIYLALRRKGLLVSIFTNACLVTEDHAALFRRYPPRDIEVTVYGATRETYERVTRVPGSFAAFERGLALLLGSGNKVRLKAMAVRSNFHELPAIAGLCRGHTMDFYRFDPVLHMRLDGDRARNLEIAAERLAPAEIVALEQADAERRQTLREGLRPAHADSRVRGRGHMQPHLPLRRRQRQLHRGLRWRLPALRFALRAGHHATTCAMVRWPKRGMSLCPRCAICGRSAVNTWKRAGRVISSTSA